MARTLAAEARKLGAEHGHNAATWADNDAIAEHAAAILADGEPDAWADARSGPLSGEWAGDPTPNSLARELGVAVWLADGRRVTTAERMAEREPERWSAILDEYETAYETAYADTLAERARAYVD